MVSIFNSDIRREFPNLLKWWFGCVAVMGVAFPLIAAVSLGALGYAMGLSAPDVAWTFLRDSQEPMLMAVAGLHLFGVVAVFIGYGFVVEISSLLFSGGGSMLVSLIVLSVSLAALAASRAVAIRAAPSGGMPRFAGFALGFPAFRPSRAGLLRASNPAGAVPRLE